MKEQKTNTKKLFVYIQHLLKNKFYNKPGAKSPGAKQYGDGPTDQPTDGPTDRQTNGQRKLLSLCLKRQK
jgi:hypothetical protein